MISPSSLQKTVASKLLSYCSTLGSSILSASNPIKLVVGLYVLVGILPFIAAFVFLMINAVNGNPDIDKFIKLGSTLIGESSISFVTFILGLCIDGKALINNHISKDPKIMNNFLKANNMTVVKYTEEENKGTK